MRTLYKKLDRFVYNKIKISRMIPSFLCYVPPSVEFLEPTTPPVFKPDCCPCDRLLGQASSMEDFENLLDVPLLKYVRPHFYFALLVFL